MTKLTKDIVAYRKAYYQENKERIKIQNTEFCPYCQMLFSNKTNHETSKRHQDNFALGLPSEEEIQKINELRDCHKKFTELSLQINRHISLTS